MWRGRRITALCDTREAARLREAELLLRLRDEEIATEGEIIEWLGQPAVEWAGDWITSTLRRPMVYVWLDGDRVLYVGKSAGGIARPLDPRHHVREAFGPRARLLCWCVESPEAAERLEAELIRRSVPLLNSRQNGGGRFNGPGVATLPSAVL